MLEGSEERSEREEGGRGGGGGGGGGGGFHPPTLLEWYESEIKYQAIYTSVVGRNMACSGSGCWQLVHDECSVIHSVLDTLY